MKVIAGNEGSNAVDLYNGASGTWSTAQLSVARAYFAATSVGNLAIFAGGRPGNCSFEYASCDGGFALELLCADDACLRRVFVAALWCMRCRRLLSHEGHCSIVRIFQCCGLVQLFIGRNNNSSTNNSSTNNSSYNDSSANNSSSNDSSTNNSSFHNISTNNSSFHSQEHMVDCAAQRGAKWSCRDICWERGHLRGGLYR